jgi:hypothetical protein
MTTTLARVPLYERLPEIYRIRDAEQTPLGQLRAYLAAVEAAFSAIHANIDSLYHDLFIETCDDWVIPYIGDLLGTTHLKGEPRTLRADVADTIALRRRKGTLGAIERLATNLTGWACRGVELRENLGWTQHLNHQRPDAGGHPPYGFPTITRFTVPRGGTAPIRDPAMLDLLGTPFDPFAYIADTKPAIDDTVHFNLPNLAIFLWRLEAYRLRLARPLAKGFGDLGPPPAGSGLARFAVRFDLHPLDYPVRLFNTHRTGFLRTDVSGGAVSPLIEPDAVPGPMLDARLTSGSEAGRPEAYVHVDFFNDGAAPPTGFDLTDVGLHFFLPLSQQPSFATLTWTFRGDNLCAWETGLRRPLAEGEIVIDPDIGRVLVGVATAVQRDALIVPEGAGFAPLIYTSFTYGAVGPVGAHPVGRAALPESFEPVEERSASALPGGTSLQTQLNGLDTATQTVAVEITDSLVHPLDIAGVAGANNDDGAFALRLAQSLVIRAADDERPIVLLAQPLRFRPVDASAATDTQPTVRLEGLYLARGPDFPAGEPLIERAAVARLELIGCTLDPGGHSLRDGTRAPLAQAMRVANDYGFALQADIDAFAPTPDIVIQRSIVGALRIDDRYRLDVSDSIVDAGLGVGDTPAGTFAIAAVTNPATDWGARLDFSGITVLGPVRVAQIAGSGGIFVHRLEVHDHQRGCIKWSYFSGDGDRLPPNHFCVHAPDALLAFISERFNDPAYAQFRRSTDRRVLTLGPNNDAMGAFGFLLEAHKWINLQVRLREFMPVGVRPLVVPVT